MQNVRWREINFVFKTISEFDNSLKLKIIFLLLGINLDLQDSGTGWDFDRGIAKSLEHRYDINDIYSNSWGLILPLQTNIGYIHPWIKEAMRRTAENVSNFLHLLFIEKALFYTDM